LITRRLLEPKRRPSRRGRREDGRERAGMEKERRCLVPKQGGLHPG
jgi:hypothetical protein